MKSVANVALLSSSTVTATGIWCFDVTQLNKAGWLYDPEPNVVSGGCEDVGRRRNRRCITVDSVEAADSTVYDLSLNVATSDCGGK